MNKVLINLDEGFISYYLNTFIIWLIMIWISNLHMCIITKPFWVILYEWVKIFSSCSYIKCYDAGIPGSNLRSPCALSCAKKNIVLNILWNSAFVSKK